MLAQDQREQARKLFAYLDTQTTAIADTVYRNEVADYTCRKQFARERELFFRRGPLFVGLSCLLPRAGDYMSHDYVQRMTWASRCAAPQFRSGQLRISSSRAAMAALLVTISVALWGTAEG